MLNVLMAEENMTMYRLSKNSGVPYMTVNDICSGRAQLEKCSAETVYRLAKVLGVSMEALISPCMEKRESFELFKSNVCHRVKILGDIDFIVETLDKDDVSKYYQRKWYPESLYLLAMLDYLSRINEVPLCTRYDELRQCKLDEIIFPAGILTTAIVTKDESIKDQAINEAIPEFIRFNIVESEIKNVV